MWNKLTETLNKSGNFTAMTEVSGQTAFSYSLYTVPLRLWGWEGNTQCPLFSTIVDTHLG